MVKQSHAFKGYVSSYNVKILNSSNPELQPKDTESEIQNKLTDLLSELKGFKFVITLVLEFKKIQSDDKTLQGTFYSNSKAETIINLSDIDDVFKSIYITAISNIQKSLGQGSGWIIDSVIDNNVNVSKYNIIAGSSYIKLPKELDHLRKCLNNIQNIADNECFKWCLKWCLHFADRKLARITKADKDFAKRLDFNEIKF